jgi:hypothetical protein
MKKFLVEFEFPGLPSSHYRQSWIGRATKLSKAPFEAFKEVGKRPGIKGKRIHFMKVSVSKIDEPKEEPTPEVTE